MSELSHVGMEYKLCPVCTKPVETGTLLLDKRMEKTIPAKPVTGYGELCEEHAKYFAEGYIALVAAQSLSTANPETLTLKDANRTGDIVHIRLTVFENIFNIPIPTDKEGKPLAFVFVDPDVITLLEKTSPKSKEDNDGK